MKLLAVETATGHQSVALLDGTQVLARSDQDAAGSHAKRLVPTIDALLASSGLTLSELDGLVVSIGPGSFTGLRVGLATMMGFRFVTGLPLVAVPTLEAMAWTLRGANLPLCPILKARTGEVYWALFEWTGANELKRLADDRIGTPDQVARSITGATLMFGDGWLAHRDALSGLLGAKACPGPLEAMVPSAVSVGLAGLERLCRGEVAGLGLAPRYVQRAEAEITMDGKAASRRGNR